MMEYRGYVGVVEYDDDAQHFHGRVVGLRDVITFVGTSVEELRREFRASVDDYLAFCRERGEEPERPYSGKLFVRADPDLHRAVASAAARQDKSLNAWVIEQLQEAVARAE